jgi:hypothetical protein
VVEKTSKLVPDRPANRRLAAGCVVQKDLVLFEKENVLSPRVLPLRWAELPLAKQELLPPPRELLSK